MFAIEHWGVEPDIVLIAKGLTSGYAPLGGVAVSEAIADSFESNGGVEFAHGFTFAGNPVACAGALKNIQILESEKLAEKSRVSGDYLQEKLRIPGP